MSETTGDPGRHSAEEPRPDQATPDAPAAPFKLPTIWEQLGGPMGMVDSGLPIVVFILVNTIASLNPAIIAALAAGVLIFIARLVRRKPVTQALSGLFGVGIAAFIAHRSGSAGGYFVLGIYSYLVYGSLLLLSMVVRRPAVGLIWESINGRGSAWRKDKALVRRYDWATAVWLGIFAARYLVQIALLGREQIGWLGVTKLAMGYPLYIAGIAASVWIVARGTGWKPPSMATMMGRKQEEQPPA